MTAVYIVRESNDRGVRGIVVTADRDAAERHATEVGSQVEELPTPEPTP